MPSASLTEISPIWTLIGTDAPAVQDQWAAPERVGLPLDGTVTPSPTGKSAAVRPPSSSSLALNDRIDSIWSCFQYPSETPAATVPPIRVLSATSSPPERSRVRPIS